MAIVVHMGTSGQYGRLDAEIFLKEILPSALEVPLQVAHVAGGGRDYTDGALGVFVDAISAHDQRMKNVYTFERVLYGSDLTVRRPREEWEMFAVSVPLTELERKTIAANVAPYYR